MINQDGLLKILKEKNIDYKRILHKPLFTVEDSKKFRGEIEGAHTKNLFLKNKKNQFFLISCLESTKINLKLLQKHLNLGNISFARENYLKDLLNVIPGSVTPFGLLNDKEKKIKFFMDIKLLSFNLLNFHPLNNTATLMIKKEDFNSLLKSYNIKIHFLNLETLELINESRN